MYLINYHKFHENIFSTHHDALWAGSFLELRAVVLISLGAYFILATYMLEISAQLLTLVSLAALGQQAICMRSSGYAAQIICIHFVSTGSRLTCSLAGATL